MLIKLFLSAPITFILMYAGKYLISDKDVPQEFPFIMFEVVVFFGLVARPYCLIRTLQRWLTYLRRVGKPLERRIATQGRRVLGAAA